MKLKFSAACFCHKGRLRGNNEDNILFDRSFLPEQNSGLSRCLSAAGDSSGAVCFAVFDGMGGSDLGEAASHASAEAMASMLPGEGEDINRFWLDCCERMNSAVCAEARARGCSMGSTVCAMILREGKAYTMNLGDSRIYMLRDKRLHRLSLDHLEKLPEGASPRKACLTQHLGIEPDQLSLEPALSMADIIPGDRFLLCSDGLTDMLGDGDIEKALSSARRPAAVVKGLFRQAMAKGGRDNISIIYIRIR